MRNYKMLIFTGCLGIILSLSSFADHRGHHRSYNHHRGGSGFSIGIYSNGFSFGQNHGYSGYRAAPRCVQYYAYDYWGRPTLVRDCNRGGGYGNYYRPYSRGWY